MGLSQKSIENIQSFIQTWIEEVSNSSHGTSEMHSWSHVAGCRVSCSGSVEFVIFVVKLNLCVIICNAQELNSVSVQSGAGLSKGEDGEQREE